MNGNKKNKGFTLIELLAVIVVLALIALISTPIILNIIEKARKNAFLDSTYGIMDSARVYYIEKILNGEEIEEEVFSFEENTNALNYSGRKPEGGTVIIREDGTISFALHDNKWCISKGSKDTNVAIKKYEEGKCTIPDNGKDPVVSLNGKASITLTVGDTYTEEGAVAKTIDGEELTFTIKITKEDIEVESIDTSKEGTYVITYIAENNGKISKVSRIVVIESNEISVEEIMENPGENGKIVEDMNHNKRFAGSNPNNWVCFGDSSITEPSNCDENHKWRIIGLFDGKMKIMTNYYYSEAKIFDTSNKNWARPANLNIELNGSSFYGNDTYIDTTHRNYIANSIWHIGGESPAGKYTFQAFINGEKSNSWIGHIGLMSVVDFGYAGINCTLTTSMFEKNNVCMYNNWIGYEKNKWTITPFNGGGDTVAWYVYANSTVGSQYVSYNGSIQPVLYLESDVRVIRGEGIESNPYIITK